MARRPTRNRSTRAAAKSRCGLDATDGATLRRLKQVMVEAGYLESGIAPLASMRELPPGVTDDSAPATALNTLLRLFHNGIAVPIKDAARALRPVTLQALLGAGMIRSEGGSVQALVYIQPYRDLLFAVERALDDGADLVMLVSGSTLELSNFTVRRHSRNSADLGTGCGFHAVMAASYSDHVFALDLNPRAVEVTRFNCILNSVENVTCRAGNLFEPVRSERFDLIVSNPPYVISPASRLIYRDSGSDGDEFCLKVARQSVRRLNQGGYFQMLFQWVQFAGQDWQEGLAERFGGLGCDLWCMRLCVQEPEEHVAAYMTAYDDQTLRDKWLRYLQRRNIESIGTGLLALRRQSGPSNVLGFDEAFPNRDEAYGDAVERLFINRRWLKDRSESALLAEKFLPTPHLRMAAQSQLQGGGWQPTTRELFCEKGLKYCFQVESFVPQLIAACDGRRTLQQVIKQVAALNRLPQRAQQEESLEWAQGLVHYGLLTPVSAVGASAIGASGNRRSSKVAGRSQSRD